MLRGRRVQLVCACLVLAVCSASTARSATAPACVGDCQSRAAVLVDDVLGMVRIALGADPVTTCAAGDANADGRITIGEILRAVRNVLDGCWGAPIQLQAAIDFGQPLEPINMQLLGTGGPVPFPTPNQALRTAVQPPFMRIDVGFEDSGCPGDPGRGPLYDATDNSFDYCQLDYRLALAEAAGARVLLIIDYTPLALIDPACAATDGHGFGAQHCPPTDYEKYGALVEAMIRHVYTQHGVTDFEVWNEPDGVYFAGTLADYLHLYTTSNAALLRAEAALKLPDHTLHLGGPATTIAHRSWNDALLTAAVADPSLRVDFISWHNYANRLVGSYPDPTLYAGTYADDTAKVRDWVAPFLAQRPDWHPLLWIDEWNVNASFDYRMDTAYGAAFIVAAFHGMQDAALDRAARFNTWDSAPASASEFIGNWGLFTNDGQVRPTFFAMALWRAMAPQRVGVQLLDGASIARDASTRTRYTQNLLASIDPLSGRATILIYNFVPYGPLSAKPPYCGDGPDLEATLDLHGLADGSYALTREQIDCSTRIQPSADTSLPVLESEIEVTGGSAELKVTAPPDSMLLVSISR